MRRGILNGGQNRNCQGFKLSEKWFFTRRKLIDKKRDCDTETQTLESRRRETCIPTLQIQKFNQSDVICTTREEEEEEEGKENKSAACDARPDSRLSRNEIFITDSNSPTLRDASSILGAPNDTYERLSDIRDHGKVSGVKWPLTIRVCNGCRVSKAIRERVFAATCLQTDPTRYRIKASCSRADPPTAKSGKNVEENSYGTDDKMPRVFSPKSFKDISKKASPTMRAKKNRTSSSLRGRRKLIAVKGCFTTRKKVAECHKKKRTYGKRKDTDNEVVISRDSDGVRCAGNGKDNEQAEKFEKFFCEPSGSQNLAKCSIKCRNITQTKSKHSSFSEMVMKTESTKTPKAGHTMRRGPRLGKKKKSIFKTAEDNSSQSKKEEWKDFSQGSERETTPNSFPNVKISPPIPRGRQIQRDKEISSVMTIWHWLRRRHRLRGAERTPSLYNGSSGQDVKDPFLSLFFPLIAGSGFLMSTGKPTSGAKDDRNL